MVVKFDIYIYRYEKFSLVSLPRANSNLFWIMNVLATVFAVTLAKSIVEHTVFFLGFLLSCFHHYTFMQGSTVVIKK